MAFWARFGDLFSSRSHGEFYASYFLKQILVCANNNGQNGQIFVSGTIPGGSPFHLVVPSLVFLLCCIHLLCDKLFHIYILMTFTCSSPEYCQFLLRHYHHHHHHQVALTAQISQTLSLHPSLSSIVSGRSSKLHPVSAQS